MKKIRILTIICMGLLANGVSLAQKTIPLYDGKIPNLKDTTGAKENTFYWGTKEQPISFVVGIVKPSLTIYLPDKKIATGQAVVICPGGGYSGVAIDHEGHLIAKKMIEKGIAAFVLKYRMPNALYMNNKEIVPLQDAQRAIQIVRENATKWNINPHKIGIMGSSAGGHLAATAGTHYQKAVIENPKNTSLRPDFLILNYPVISFADSLTHYGSRMNLVGDLDPAEIQKIGEDYQNSEKKLASFSIDKAKIKEFSNELHVTADTPPTFITHATDDEVVKVQNSLLFIAALQQHGVPVSSFLYAKGGHGYGIENSTAKVNWLDSCLGWLLEMNK